MGYATEKMIKYADGIADALGIEKPHNYEFNTVRNYIETFKEEYKNFLSKGIIDINYELVVSEYAKCSYEMTVDLYKILKDYSKGIYVFWSEDELVYIGKSLKLKERIITSLRERNTPQTPITHIQVINVVREADVHILEVLLIIKYKPKLNTDCKCDDYSNVFNTDINLYKLPRYEIARKVEGV